MRKIIRKALRRIARTTYLFLRGIILTLFFILLYIILTLFFIFCGPIAFILCDDPLTGEPYTLKALLKEYTDVLRGDF